MRAAPISGILSSVDPRYFRYLLVGGLNTAFGYGVFALLFLLGVHYALAAFCSTVLGVLFNFFSTGAFVFGRRDVGRLPRFVAVYGITYVVGVSALRGGELLGFSPLVTSAALLLPISALAFVLQRRLVFRGAP